MKELETTVVGAVDSISRDDPILGLLLIVLALITATAFWAIALLWRRATKKEDEFRMDQRIAIETLGGMHRMLERVLDLVQKDVNTKQVTTDEIRSIKDAIILEVRGINERLTRLEGKFKQ